MQSRTVLAGFTVTLAFLLVALHGPHAVARAGSGQQPKMTRIQVPFTPTREDGSRGKPFLITIEVPAEGDVQACEILEQVLYRLIVAPKLDEIRTHATIGSTSQTPSATPALDEACRQLDAITREADKSTNNEVSPAAIEVLPLPRRLEDALPAPPSPAETTEDNLLGSALQILEFAGPFLGFPFNLYPGCIPSGGVSSSESNVQPYRDGVNSDSGEVGTVLLAQPQSSTENSPAVHTGWQWLWQINQPSPSHMTYERVHGGIGP